MECYRIEKLEFDNPLFTTFTTTFLITMEESIRRKEYMYELQKWKPTKNVYILHNKGFRYCQKNNVQNSAQDLWHANKEIFKLTHNIKSQILILEDDVKFTQNIFNHATESAGVGILKTLCNDPESVIPHFVIMLQSTSSFLWGCYALIIRNTFLTLSACISLTINVSSVTIGMAYRKKKRIRVNNCSIQEMNFHKCNKRCLLID
jgi:hypothetical protein